MINIDCASLLVSLLRFLNVRPDAWRVDPPVKVKGEINHKRKFVYYGTFLLLGDLSSIQATKSVNLIIVRFVNSILAS